MEAQTTPKKWTILAITSVSTFMATLDGSIVNIALPSIAKQVNASINSVQWVVTSYLLTISLLLLVYGKLSDLFGKKYFFSSGFIVFAVGSTLCGLSGSLTMLVVSRVIQAVGASAMMSLSQGIITSVFPSNERGRALGFVGAMVAFGSLTGPSLGGVLVGLFGWESIFYINVPIGIAGFVLSLIFIPELSETQEVKRFDLLGWIFFSLSVLMLFTGLLMMQAGALSMLYLLPMLIGAAVCMFLFIRTERRTENPLLDPKLFRLHEFSSGLVCAYLSFIATFATLLFMPFYLEDLLRLDSAKAGLLIACNPLTMAVAAPISGWLSDKISYRPLTVLGMAVCSADLFFISTFDEQTSIARIALSMILLGLGTSFFQSPNNSSVMGSVPRQQLGIAGGINALARNLGMVSGASFSVLIYFFVTKTDINSLGAGVAGDAFLRGFSRIMLFCSAICLISMIIGLVRARGYKPVPDKSE